jgi:hypothetical protein
MPAGASIGVAGKKRRKHPQARIIDNPKKYNKDMSEFIYRKAHLLAPDTRALLGSVLVAIPKTAVEELRTRPDRKHAEEDALFRELINDADLKIINQLVISPFGQHLTEFEAFPMSETGDLSNPQATSPDGKRFWRLSR